MALAGLTLTATSRCGSLGPAAKSGSPALVIVSCTNSFKKGGAKLVGESVWKLKILVTAYMAWFG